MAQVGIFNTPRTRWVQFDEDTEVELRHIGKEELTEITRKANKASRLGGADAKDVFGQRFARAAVCGWRKIGDHGHPGLIVDGKPFPFSEENLSLLMRCSLEFSAFVNEEAVDSRAFLDDQKEGTEEVKNA